MNVVLAKASYPPNAAERKPERKTPPPFRLPQKKEGEDYKVWVTLVKKGSPKITFNFDGVDFAQYWQPTSASIVGHENAAKRSTVIPTKNLTESQAAAILAHAKKIEFWVQPKPNSAFNRHEKDSKLFHAGRWVNTHDCIVLELAKSFDLLNTPEYFEGPQSPIVEEPKDLVSEVAENLYAQQGKKKKR